MSDLKSKIVEADSLKIEKGAKGLMSAPEMQPYLRYTEAVMTKGNVQVEEVASPKPLAKVSTSRTFSSELRRERL